MPTDAPPPYVPNDVFAHYGRRLIKNFWDNAPTATMPPPAVPDTLSRRSAAPPSYSVATSSAASASSTPVVGILGAGIGGLYTALILEDLGIPYKVIEARDRVGGRLYTHTFRNSTGAPYNYFDVGAMRFPKIDSMRRVFRLFEYEPLNTGDLALYAKLQPFYFVGAANNDTFLSYNGVTVKQNAVPDASLDPFHASAVIQDTIPTPYIAAGVKAITDDVIGPFARELLIDLRVEGRTVGWEKLLAVDKYSTRAYMSLAYEPSPELGLPKGPLPTDVVNWLETFDKSTGWYDRAFSETVLEAIAFGWNPVDDPMVRTPWFCIDGGSFQIADTVHQYLRARQSNSILFNKRVTGISLASDENSMEVTTDNYEKHQFDHVITTIPLPVLRSINLSGANLSPMQANAIRQLNYGPSVKIGMQFRTAWWTTGNDKDGQPLNIIGGQTYTDCPLRTVVYPSFGDVKAGKTTTLIASYCWTEDSERLAALINSDTNVLIEMVLRELAGIHNVTVEFLRGQLIDTFSWSWSLDPFTMGAFAFFGPGKFGNAYASLNSPAAKGRLHFAGEAISVRHAWVEGALDSAWRAVFDLLLEDGFTDAQREKFFVNWGYNAEWIDDQVLAPRKGPVSAPPPGQDRSLPSEDEPFPDEGSPLDPVPGEPFSMPMPGMPVPEENKKVDVQKILSNSLLVRHRLNFESSAL